MCVTLRVFTYWVVSLGPVDKSLNNFILQLSFPHLCSCSGFFGGPCSGCVRKFTGHSFPEIETLWQESLSSRFLENYGNIERDFRKGKVCYKESFASADFGNIERDFKKQQYGTVAGETFHKQTCNMYWYFI